MNAIPAETANTPAAALAEQPKLPKKPRVAAQAANVASSKARSGHKATAAKKANRGATSAKPPKKAVGARLGSKAAKVLDLLKRYGGASLKELMKATGPLGPKWPPGLRLGGFFLSGPRTHLQRGQFGGDSLTPTPAV